MEDVYVVALRHKVLSKSEEVALLTRYAKLRKKHGAEHAKTLAVRNEIVALNLRLVSQMAQRYKRLPREDLISEGSKGLIKSVERFEVERGLRFSTYASNWIRHHLQRANADLGTMVRVPVHQQEKMRHGLRDHDGIRIDGTRALSIDAPLVNGADSGTLHDVLTEEPANGNAPEALDMRRLAHVLRRLVESVLTEREREIIESRFLRDTDETLQQVGDRMASLGGRGKSGGRCSKGGTLSRERIRQLEALALGKLHRALVQLGVESAR